MTALHLESRLTEAWIGKVPKAERTPATRCELARESARQRLACATERVQQTQSQAWEIVKLLLGTALAAWAGLALFKVRPRDLELSALACWFVALELWAAAAVYALRACLPGSRPHSPLEEEEVGDRQELAQAFERMARLRQTVAATETETDIAARQTGFILFAIGSLALAVMLFMLTLFLGAHR